MEPQRWENQGDQGAPANDDDSSSISSEEEEDDDDDLSSRIINGTAMAAQIRHETAEAVAALAPALRPRLALVAFRETLTQTPT